MIKKIVVLGAGNVATHLVKAFIKEGFNICQIYSRSIESARELGIKTGVHYTNVIDDIYKHADVYIICLKDSIISSVLAKISLENNPLLIHTAGSVSKEELGAFSKNYGVLYPLQTFSKDRELYFRNIPLCYDANNTANMQYLKKLCSSLSDNNYKIGDEERKVLHLAAVFACNFSNYMYSLAEDILEAKNIEFDIMKPLIQETASKIIELSPRKAQTGPAIRNDKITMNKHKDLLENNNELRKLYTFISNNILKFKDKDGIF